ncbi:hypothetical protein EON67_02695 [archaeon]|nr:MAG: hypothetical protein EON67_02695 [archaeon]
MVQDCWVVIHGRVYDISSLLRDAASADCAPILAQAGQDISHWFDLSPAHEITVC